MDKKTIYTISSVKDEADIIESLVRYTLNFADGMVINENGSTDNTLAILKQLKSEGLNIDIIEDTKSEYVELEKKKELLNYVMKKYSPDWVLCLDADEFLFEIDYKNPRNAILSLNPLEENQILWRTFVLNGDEKKEEQFIPKRVLYRRDESCEEFAKAVISKELYKKGCLFSLGAHTLYGSEFASKVNYPKDLFLGHYPVRSINQLTARIISGALNVLAQDSRESGRNFHHFEMLDKIIQNGCIDKETLCKESLYYAISDKSIDIKKELKPLDVSFCKGLDMKYSPKEPQSSLSIALSIGTTLIEKLRVEKEILHNEKVFLENELSKKEKELEEIKALFHKTISSRGWIFLEKLRKIKRWVKKS
ncbi:MAG: glycosyltransferase family 2 protein [Candidatus Dojkabacteria bacterium]|jgi:glycosyltransferase involved in cell wall biosynthesis